MGKIMIFSGIDAAHATFANLVVLWGQRRLYKRCGLGISVFSLLASLTLFSYFYCSVLVGESYKSLIHAEDILLICFSCVLAVHFSLSSFLFTIYDVLILHSLRPLC